jgi:hypothetical protein
MKKIPDTKEYNEEWTKDVLHWKLYCFEMLYLWNTLSSCRTTDLDDIITRSFYKISYLMVYSIFKSILECLPPNEESTLKHEPMRGIGWFMRGTSSSILANRFKNNADDLTNRSKAYFTIAVEAFRMCLKVRTDCSDDAHISAFAQYELALLLLRSESVLILLLFVLFECDAMLNFLDSDRRKVALGESADTICGL